MKLTEASVIWVNFKEELKFLCDHELYLDKNPVQCEELLQAILLLEDYSLLLKAIKGSDTMKDNKAIIEETTFDDEWYQPYFTCMSCGVDFMCAVVKPSYCPRCGKKIIGIKSGLMTSYYLGEEVKE